MAELWFSTAAEVAANAPGSDLSGSSWANRAPLISGGVLNTLITAFDFTANNLTAWVAYVSGYPYEALTTAIQTFTGTTAPSAAYPCILHACDSTGAEWVPPDLDWVSAQPEWDSSSMPELSTSTTIYLMNNSYVGMRGLKLSTNAGNQIIGAHFKLDWLIIENSRNSSSANCVFTSTGSQKTNLVLRCSGTGFAYCCSVSSQLDNNIRCEGNPAATTGTRYGIHQGSNAPATFNRVTVVGCPGGGIVAPNVNSNIRFVLSNITIVDCGVGVEVHGTNTTYPLIIGVNLYIANSGTYAIVNAGTGAFPTIGQSRIRNSGTAALSGSVNADYLGNDFADGVEGDAEFADYAGGDYRIANSSAYWAKKWGAGDEPAAGGGSGGSPFWSKAFSGGFRV